MSKRDYYEVLGIAKGADNAAIKKAYRNLAMQYHPDRNPGDGEAAEKMKEINEAYAVLSDGHKRSLYDTYGHAGLEGYSQDDLFRGVDFSSLFREFGLGDIFGFGDGIFDGLFGRRTTSRRGPLKGADLRYNLSLTLEDVAFGVEKTIELPRTEKCKSCNGTGAEPGGLEQCEACQGTGQIVKEQRSGYSVFRQISGCSKCRGSGKIVKEACKHCEGEGVIQDTEEIEESTQGRKKVLFTVALMFVFLFAMLVFGFTLGTFIFLICSVWSLGYKNKKGLIISSLIITGFMYVIFILIMKSFLPSGLLFDILRG